MSVDLELNPRARWIAHVASKLLVRGGGDDSIVPGPGEVLVEFPYSSQPDPVGERYDPAALPTQNRPATPQEMTDLINARRDIVVHFNRGRDEVVVTLAWTLRRLLGPGHPTKVELEQAIDQWKQARELLDQLRQQA